LVIAFVCRALLARRNFSAAGNRAEKRMGEAICQGKRTQRSDRRSPMSQFPLSQRGS